MASTTSEVNDCPSLQSFKKKYKTVIDASVEFVHVTSPV